MYGPTLNDLTPAGRIAVSQEARANEMRRSQSAARKAAKAARERKAWNAEDSEMVAFLLTLPTTD